MSTAFVLTGGGSLGAVQVGMLSALHEHGIDADLLVGTSIGAVNAAYLAGPGTAEERLASLAALWRSVRRRDVFAADPRRWVGAAMGGAPSLFSGEQLRLLLAHHLGYAAFEDARVEVHVTATDLVTGQGLVVDSGPVVSAVLASAAVPGVFPPVARQGRTMVDGAVGAVDTLAHVDATGVDHIYLLPAGYPCAGPAPTTALGTAMTSLSLLLHRQLMEQVHRYSGRAALHVMPPMCPLSVSPADFSGSAALITRAHRVTAAWLAGMEARPNGGAGALSLHDHRQQERSGQSDLPSSGRPLKSPA